MDGAELLAPPIQTVVPSTFSEEIKLLVSSVATFRLSCMAIVCSSVRCERRVNGKYRAEGGNDVMRDKFQASNSTCMS